VLIFIIQYTGKVYLRKNYYFDLFNFRTKTEKGSPSAYEKIRLLTATLILLNKITAAGESA
jgi:hypothetical protein